MYLIRINKTYHFRFRVTPAKLIPVLGRREIKASLRTRDKQRAKTLAHVLANGCRTITSRLAFKTESVLMKLDSKALNNLIRAEIRKTIDHYVGSFALEGGSLKEHISSLDQLIDNAKSVLDAGYHYSWMHHNIARITQETGRDLDAQFMNT